MAPRQSVISAVQMWCMRQTAKRQVDLLQTVISAVQTWLQDKQQKIGLTCYKL